MIQIGGIHSMKNKLKSVLDNLGPGIHDVAFYDRDFIKVDCLHLRQFDFDNIKVLSVNIDESTIGTNWIVMNVKLDIKVS